LSWGVFSLAPKTDTPDNIFSVVFNRLFLEVLIVGSFSLIHCIGMFALNLIMKWDENKQIEMMGAFKKFLFIQVGVGMIATIVGVISFTVPEVGSVLCSVLIGIAHAVNH
jgi:hypothetical protein